MGFSAVTDEILRTLGRPGRAYVGTLICLAAVLAVAVYAFLYQVRVGLGVAGYQHPALWGIYNTNFVFWIGITHSGTLISAVLFLLRARWRTGVARASEAMTVFAIMTGALFPIVHLGRPWLFYWLLPYPNERQLWVNFRSPLIWDTIFAPFFVAGAIFSGVAMIITLLVPLRTLLGLEDHMQVRHFEQLGKLLLTMSLILSYAYAMEFFGAWYSGSAFERSTYWARVTGPYAPYTWAMLVCNGLIPLTLFSRRVRTNLRTLAGVALFALIGIWVERYVIVVSSLTHGFDPANWMGVYRPTWVEGAITAGSFALCFLLFLLFVKLFPVVSMHETKAEMAT